MSNPGVSMLRGALIACMFASSSHLLAGYTIGEQLHIQRVVHDHLVRMGRIHDGPYHEEQLAHKLEELERDVSAYRDLALETLSHFLRNPEDDFQECTVTRAVLRFVRDLPEDASRMMVRALPTENSAGDRCVLDVLVRLGPDAYPYLLRCAKGKVASKSSWCLAALLEQSIQLPGVDRAIGLVDEVGRQREPPSSRGDIARAAARWETWWDEARDGLRWNRQTYRLEQLDR